MIARVASVIALGASACGWSGFEPKDRELVACWPACGIDAGAPVLDLGVDARVPDRPDGGDVLPDLGVRDGGLELGPLYADFSTPNTITFFWEREQVPEGSTGFVLRYDSEGEVVRAGGGSAWSSEADVNLGYVESPFGPGAVNRTTVRDLAPNTVYFARLYALTRSGERPIAEGSGHTVDVPELAVELFTEAVHGEVGREGFEDPALATRARSGVQALWFVAGEGEQHVALTELGLVFGELPADRFSAAYLELFISVAGDGDAQPTPFIETMLFGENAAPFSHVYSVLPARDGWTQVQLSLRGFAGPLTPMALGGTISGFGLVARWPVGSMVFVDDVVLRY